MGSPTDADLVVSQNIGSADRILKHYFTEAVGYGLWALFHILTVIVLLNMLIAMMSDSFQRIQVCNVHRRRLDVSFCLLVDRLLFIYIYI